MDFSGEGDGSFPFRSLLASQRQLEQLEILSITSSTAAMDAVTEFGAGLKNLVMS